MVPLGRMAKHVVAVAGGFLITIALVGAQSGGPHRSSGIYLESPDHATDPVRIVTSMPMTQVDGVGKSMLTGGLLKPKMVTKLSGEASSNRTAATQPTFIFVFNDPKARNQTAQSNQGMPEMGSLPMGLTSPKDFTLVRLTVADGQRQNDSGKMQQVKVQIENLASKTEFRVRPASALEPGEYGFLPPGNGGMIWDFGVDAAK
jgi:hypothetical protein